MTWSRGNNPRFVLVREQRNPQQEFSDTDWRQLCKAYEWACAYCLRRTRDLTVDHVVPLNRGGARTIDNVVPACAACNTAKANSLPTGRWIPKPPTAPMFIAHLCNP